MTPKETLHRLIDELPDSEVAYVERYLNSQRTRKIQDGSVQGLCSAAATVFSLALAFFGIWGFKDENPWLLRHLWVIIPALISFGSLALTPWSATRPYESEEKRLRSIYKARRRLLIGAVFVFLLSLMQSFLIGDSLIGFLSSLSKDGIIAL